MKTHRDRMAEDSAHSSSNYMGETLDDNLRCVMSRTRDSDFLDNHNWNMVIEMLGEDNVEIHRFGSWLCGWFEELYVEQFCCFGVQTAAYIQAADLRESLENYPILDEDKYSEAESAEADKDWDEYAKQETLGALCVDLGLDPDEWAAYFQEVEWEHEGDPSDFIFNVTSYAFNEDFVKECLRFLNGKSLRGLIDRFGEEMRVYWAIEPDDDQIIGLFKSVA